jgi:hypothetical protein
MFADERVVIADLPTTAAPRPRRRSAINDRQTT